MRGIPVIFFPHLTHQINLDSTIGRYYFYSTIGRYGTTFIQLSVGMYYFYSDPTNQIYPDQAHPINLDQLLPTYIRIQPFLS